MSNVKGYKELVASGSEQDLTTDFLVLGEEFSQPDIEQMVIYLNYTAGTEDGLSLVLRSEDPVDAGENYNEPSYTNAGGGSYMVAEQVYKIDKTNAGRWAIPFLPKGKKKWKIMVEGYGAAASGTISAFVRYFDNI